MPSEKTKLILEKLKMMTFIFDRLEDLKEFGEKNPFKGLFCELWPLLLQLLKEYQVGGE